MKRKRRHSKRIREAIATLALILAFSATGFAQEPQSAQPEKEDNVIVLDKVEVKAAPHEQGKIVIDRDKLDKLPSATGSITESLRIQSDIQFDESFGSSLQGGEIAPPEISISGAKPYETRFNIDGLGINNYISPEGFSNSPTGFPSAPAQSMFIDTDLIDSIKVYTSNIPAKYGSFTGGVVDAKIRDPKKKFGGKLSARHTRDKWSNQRPNDNDDFELSSNPENQPFFSRYDGSVSIDVPLSESTGALLGYTIQHSTIPLHYMDDMKDQYRANENFLAKLVHDFDSETSADISFLYNPYKTDNFTASSKDSEYQNYKNSMSLALGFEKKLDLGKLELRAGYSETENRREAENNVHTTWTKLHGTSTQWGNETRNAKEGGFGDSETTQKAFSSSADFTTTELELGPTTHTFNIGVSLENVFGTYAYLDDRTAYYAPKNSSIVKDNGQGGVIPGEQYTMLKSEIDSSNGSANMNLLAAYLDDTLTFGRLTLRPGLRVSYDDLLENTNLEPRLFTSFDILGDGKYTLTAGANRYYGAPIMSYALRDMTPTTYYMRTLNSSTGELSDWRKTRTTGTKEYNLGEMDTPYSDEITLGASAEVLGGIASFEYVNRKHRDQFSTSIIRDGGDTSYILSNQGRTDYEGYTLKFAKNINENHWVSLSATYSEKETNFADYADQSLESGIAGYDFSKVYYDGELINRTDLPAEAFNRPWVVAFVYSGKFFDRLTFTNTTRFASAMTTLVKKGKYTDNDGVNYYKYEKSNIDQLVTFDWQLDYEAWKYKNQLLTLNLSVMNVFDATSIVDRDGNKVNGRQFWAGATYEF